MVALAGAGGKTSLMWHLAERLARRGCRVAATTTTRVRSGEEPAGTPVIAWRGGLTIEAGAAPLVTSGRLEGDKHLGIAPAHADRLATLVDHLVVEADGARGRPFKVPRPGEPVLPSSTTHLVVVVGQAALDDMEPEHIRSLLLSRDGYLPAALGVERAFVAVNGDDEEACSRLAAALWHPALEGVIASSAHAGRARRVTNAGHRIAALVLAAGRSDRFGSQKLVQPAGGVPLVRRALDAALGSGPERVCLVVAPGADDVLASAGDALDDPRVTVETNPDPARGMGSSLRCGLDVIAGSSDAVMVFLADMPRVDASLASRVADLYRSGAARVAAPLVEGRTGHPVILHADLFPALARLEGDRGARSVVERNADRTALLEHVDPATQKDVDAPPDLQ